MLVWRPMSDEVYRRQVARLFERSGFYREKLSRAGFVSPADAGGLADIAKLPFTEKDELRQSQAAHPPLGAHACIELSEAARVYSTSGTTGTPSYIPLTSRDRDDWVTGSARSYAASGIEPGQRIVSTYNAGPFVAGAAEMTYPRFTFFNVSGSFAWVGLCFGAGFAFGNVPIVKQNFSLVTIGIVAISVLPVVIEILRHRGRSRK